MKVIYNNHHIKTVPKKYKTILSIIPDLILDEERKRLSVDEIAHLEKALLKYYFSSFFEKLKESAPLVYDYLKNSEPQGFHRYTRRNDEVEFIILFDDNKRVKCSRSDFPGLKYGDGFRW